MNAIMYANEEDGVKIMNKILKFILNHGKKITLRAANTISYPTSKMLHDNDFCCLSTSVYTCEDGRHKKINEILQFNTGGSFGRTLLEPGSIYVLRGETVEFTTTDQIKIVSEDKTYRLITAE